MLRVGWREEGDLGTSELCSGVTGVGGEEGGRSWESLQGLPLGCRLPGADLEFRGRF